MSDRESGWQNAICNQATRAIPGGLSRNHLKIFNMEWIKKHVMAILS
jgi:hypothetical protein